MPATTRADSEPEPESARSHSRGRTSLPATNTRVSTSRPDAFTRLNTSEPAAGTCLAIAPVQQNKSTIVRRRSIVCTASGSPEKCVNMSSPDAYE
ncbi:hypothetical protein P9860_026225, partial [Escherichia coli]|uniref:hypothetical protein n=1 Tax=Escherichia coli TaxID=562 RepID=UPI002550EFDE